MTSSASAGCHRLIRECDATIVTNAREACELAGLSDAFAEPRNDDPDETAWQKRVLDALPLRGGRETHEVARLAGLTAAQAGGVLAELELLGGVRRLESPGDAPAKWGLVRRQ